MNKTQTTYVSGIGGFYITVNEEVKDHMSVHKYGEPCSGVLRHWGSKKELIKELKGIIKSIKELKYE